jgi:hypothetical protein
MEKLVQANSLPYLQGGFSDATPEGKRVLSLGADQAEAVLP